MSTKSVRKTRLILIATLLISTITATLVGGYAVENIIFQSATIPVKVEDPIEILNYPNGVNLYPGQTKEFSPTVQNIADVTYTVTLDFQLNDNSYQSRYVTFKNTVITIAPGEQTFNASLTVSANAPPASLLLTISRKIDTNPSTTITPTQSPQTPQPTPSSSPTDSLTLLCPLPSCYSEAEQNGHRPTGQKRSTYLGVTTTMPTA